MLIDLRKRNLLLRVLPKTGNVDGQLRCKELAERLLNISDEHKQKVNFVSNADGSANYDVSKDEPIEFELTESEKHALKRGVNALDKEEAVSLDLVDLCKEVLDL